MCGDFTWMVSDCEELVGVNHRRWWGLFSVGAPLSWYDVPEVIEVQVLPSDEVKMFLEVPTVTNALFPYLTA